MNFQAVDQANGKNVTIWATLSTWDDISFSTNQKKLLTCKLKDDAGVEHKCRIYEGKGSLPGQEHLEKRMEFNLSTFQGMYENKPYTGYSGFWSHGTVQGLQDTPQSPPQAAQPTNHQQPAPQGKKELDTVTAIATKGSIVCAFIQSGELKLDDLSIDVATAINKWVKFILTNNNPDYVGDNPSPPTDDDVPF